MPKPKTDLLPIGQGAQAEQPKTVDASQKAAKRKLHIGHFAFMRSVVQGIDTRESWDRYLRVEGEHNDMNKVNRTIAWIRDEFAAAARRSDRHGIARLVRIDVTAVSDRASQLPTVEEFAAVHGMEDFSAMEQLEQYRTHYPTSVHRPSRRGQLIARQLEAINWLEQHVVQPPRSSDAIASWLHPDLCQRLERAGIVTLKDLADRINGMGMRWCTGLRAIGSGKAARIVDWINAHAESTGLSVGMHVASKRSTWSAEQRETVLAPATGVVPIHKLIVPVAIDGVHGCNRAPRHACKIVARDDREAIFAWILAKRGRTLRDPELKSPRANGQKILHGCDGADMTMFDYTHTQRAYLREAERFLLWAVIERRKALSSLSSPDCAAYREFLENPLPAARWCGPRNREKWGPLWRPFEGPLSPRAQRQAVTILKSLGNFLVSHGYLLQNPWDGISLPKVPPPRPARATLTSDEWEAVMAYLDQLPATSVIERLKFAMPLIEATGLRLTAAVDATVDDLRRLDVGAHRGNSSPRENWQVLVAGADGEKQPLPLSPHLIMRLSSYLASRGLNADPLHSANRGACLIGKASDIAIRAKWSPPPMLEHDPKQGIAAGTLCKQIRAFFSDYAKALAPKDPVSANRMADASSHWLR